jgi:hypothetical protein
VHQVAPALLALPGLTRGRRPGAHQRRRQF